MQTVPVQTQAENCLTKQTPFGFVEGTMGSDGLQISRVISTDLSVYLNEKYCPGSIYR